MNYKQNSRNNFIIRLYKHMLKENRGLMNFLTSKKVLFLGFFLILCFILYSYSSEKTNRVLDGYTDGYTDAYSAYTAQPTPGANMPFAMTQSPSQQLTQPLVTQPKLPQPTVSQPIIQEDTPSTNTGGYKECKTVVPGDLLPTNASNQFADFNMLNQGSINMPDLLDAGYLIGIDTIGQTLRNANYQERSDPYIPKSNVGPWNNSTIEPDLARVPLEIGTCA